MLIDTLRKKHPALVYKSFDCTMEQDNLLRVRYTLLLQPDIWFRPELIVPVPHGTDLDSLLPLIFQLGMVELISYWKAACPAEVIIEAGSLNEEQLSWWHDLFIHGLGEFFYLNSIDFTGSDFLKLRSECSVPVSAPGRYAVSDAELILVGGGKDSSVTLELLRGFSPKSAALMLNPTRAALDSARLAEYTNPLVVRRTIDPGLLRLNAEGYLNGHTPFSAYLSFLSVLVGAAHGYDKVIASNEASSNEPSLIFHGLPVNHQYSKSFRFEQQFRSYASRWLTPDVMYFSFLRPLSELQIGALFSQFPEHFFSFRSCNVNQTKDSWCGSCAKCVFVYLILFPFLDKRQLESVFGLDVAALPQNEKILRELLGIGQQKPFDCIGTCEEARLALRLCIEKCRDEDRATPALFQRMAGELQSKFPDEDTEDSLLYSWSEEHYLPEAYAALLKEHIHDL